MPITEQEIAPTRRTLLVGIAALGVSSCAYRDSLLMRHAALIGGLFAKPRPLARADVAKYAAASISVRISGGEGLVLLNRIEGRDCYWLSSDRILLVTRGGRLMQTSGLRGNLAHTQFTTPDPVDGGLLRSNRVRAVRMLDYDEFGVSIPAKSRFYVRGQDPVRILGSTIPTVRVTEEVSISALKWHFTNTYWAHSETGAVWRSRQHFHPDYSAVTITTLRPVQTPA